MPELHLDGKRKTENPTLQWHNERAKFSINLNGLHFYGEPIAYRDNQISEYYLYVRCEGTVRTEVCKATIPAGETIESSVLSQCRLWIARTKASAEKLSKLIQDAKHPKLRYKRITDLVTEVEALRNNVLDKENLKGYRVFVLTDSSGKQVIIEVGF